ncbi:MAG: hypothetical protein QNI90_07470 [Dinoroseobacter sp.]|nr:hypothetical protein [Dinoroseobacter sp.]MDJ0993395.1 hypothetical protein [Dinoroseobacter sp.]
MVTSSLFGRSALQAATLLASILCTVAIIYADVLVLGSTMAEGSLVQVSQAVLILGSAAFFALGARNHVDERGYLLLVSTVFLCMFVRENDGLLDGIAHGFWRVPVTVIGVAGVFAVLSNKKTLRSPLERHAQDSSFWILAIGFLQLIVFSRLFGSGHLWDHIPNQADLGPVKAIIQESTELLGYSLIFLGSYLAYRYLYRKEQKLTVEKASIDGIGPLSEQPT